MGGAALASIYPFIAVILSGRGFATEAIGLVTGLAAVGFTIAVPAWGHLADVRFGRVGAVRIAALGSAAALALFALPLPAAVLIACYLAWAVFESAIGPLSDALAVNALADPARDYGRIRLLGSAGFAVPAVAIGLLYDRVGYGPAPLLYAAGAVVLALGLRGIPDRPRADLSRYGQPARGGSIRVAFSVAPRLPGVVLAIALAHVGVLAGFTYLGLHLVDLGGRPSDLALSAAVSAFAEIPAMAVAGRVVRRIGLRGMFAASALGYAACLASWVLLDSPSLIIATRVVSGFAFSGLWVGSVLTMGAILPDRLQGTGQGIYQTTAFGLAAVVANAGGGLIYGSLGAGALFGSTAVLGVAAAVVAWIALPRRGEGAIPAGNEPPPGEPLLTAGDAAGR